MEVLQEPAASSPAPTSPPVPQPDEPVPGKIVLTELELAEQRRALERYADELRIERMRAEKESSRLFGWVYNAETINGRLAMIFLTTGLLTEHWTGYTLPEQLEIVARTLGIL